ncbi:MAG: DUF2231 domain-containing protein [Rhodothermales bacterium]
MFEQVFQYRIPALHPLLVHFPIATVGLALGAAMLWLVWDRRWMLMAAAVLQTLGWLATWGAFLTGEALEEQSEGVPIVDALVEFHESMAEWSLWVIGVSALLFWLMLRASRRDVSRPGSALWMRLVGFLVALGAAALIAWVSHIGGVMVWGTPV